MAFENGIKELSFIIIRKNKEFTYCTLLLLFL